MATNTTGEAVTTDELMDRISSLVQNEGRGDPRRIQLQTLGNAFDRLYGGFTASGHGKLKTFVSRYFNYNDARDEVTCPSSQRSGKRKGRNPAKREPCLAPEALAPDLDTGTGALAVTGVPTQTGAQCRDHTALSAMSRSVVDVVEQQECASHGR